MLSDLAAPATGQRTLDRLRAEALAEAVLALLPELLAPGGSLVLKLLRGAEAGVAAAARRQFARALAPARGEPDRILGDLPDRLRLSRRAGLSSGAAAAVGPCRLGHDGVGTVVAGWSLSGV